MAGPESSKLLPVVGYNGGKRRLLPRLRPYLDPSQITLYVEPFVGMGASYLDLRARGYDGPAILADANTEVASFWRAMHSAEDGARVIARAEALLSESVTAERFLSMRDERVDDAWEKIARFLWLTNYSFGNNPPVYVEDRWVLPRSGSSKLNSAAKWGKTFPWSPCVERLRLVHAALVGKPTTVESDARPLLSQLDDTAVCYADPPYRKTSTYAVGFVDFTAEIFACRGRVLFSETADLTAEMPTGWTVDSGEVVARTGAREGAGGRRVERIYRSPHWEARDV